MKSIITWFAKNRVAANILMFVIVLAGALSIPNTKVEVFPEFDMDRITVNVIYPGGAPEEVEQNICILIEEEIQDLDGIKKITSTATEGVGAITVEVQNNYSVQTLLEDVRTRVDGIDTFPAEAERPIIQILLNRKKVINIAVHGNVSSKILKEQGELIRDELMGLKGITKAELAGARPYEISIEMSEIQLKRFHLTFDQVAEAIKNYSLDLPGGSVKTESGQILLRTQGQSYSAEEFGKIPVLTHSDGSRVLLKDVADILDGFEDTDEASTYNGENTVAVKVFRTGDENALEVSALVKEVLPKLQERMPSGVTLSYFQDEARVLQGRLDLMLKNAKWGLILVFIVLALALKIDLAFWVVLGIPISFLGAFWMMPLLGVSINMISLFAFILVLGIVVDDAIVVGESVYSESRKGKKGLAAAIDGTFKVGVPVIFAVLTTMVAFTPMMGIPGFMGKIWKVIPLVVIPCLFFSLVESQLILPAHLAHFGEKKKKNGWRNFIAPFANKWSNFQAIFSNSIELFSSTIYKKTLKISLAHRYSTVAIFLFLFALSVSLIKGGHIKWEFFPEVEADFVIARIEMPEGITVKATTKAVVQVENAILEIKKKYDDQNIKVIKSVLASVGGQPVSDTMDHGGMGGSSSSSPHKGEVFVELYPSEVRDVSSKLIEKDWRSLIGEVVGVDNLILSSAFAKAGDAINIQLESSDLLELNNAAEDLKEMLEKEKGVIQPRHSYQTGKEEIKFDIREEAQASGLTRKDLARQIRQSFYGEEVQRIQRGRNEVKVMLRYPKNKRDNLSAFEEMKIRTRTGDEIPFTAVAKSYYGKGYSTINRVDRKRVISVSADVDATVVNANELMMEYKAKVLPKFLEKYKTVKYQLEGEQKEQSESLEHMMSGGILSLFIIFALIAVVFKSYAQPLIVMSAIPFGFVGAVAGHFVFGMNLNIMSMCGLLALAGVVVNDSLVLVDYINIKHKEGLNLKEAALVAGVHRFRPILLTSLTTFAGLTPLLLERSMQAMFLIPMAISLAFGVLFSTLITLVLIPAFYMILEDVKNIFKGPQNKINFTMLSSGHHYYIWHKTFIK